MDPTVTVAMIGIGGTLLSPALVYIVELLKLRTEESKEARRLQLDWLREQNTDRYNRVKNWVFEVMAVLDPTPITWTPNGPSNWTEWTADKLTARRNDLAGLNRKAAQVGLFASGDKQLAQHFQKFIDILNSLSEDPITPREKEKAYSAAAKVINRAYELMLQMPEKKQIGYVP